MTEVADVMLRCVGAFYTFAGVLATRATLMSYVVDRAISAISLQQLSKAEFARTLWLGLASVIIFLGGVALALLHNSAAWLFLAAAIGQAFYLAVLAPLIFDAADPPVGTGRQQTINAFVLYLAATAFVLWATHSGRLLDVDQMSPLLLATAGVGTAAFFSYVIAALYEIARPAAADQQASFEPAINVRRDEGRDVGSDDVSATVVTKVKVMADYNCFPLWDLGPDYRNIDPFDFGLSDDLARDLADWSAAYDTSLNQADPIASLWSDAQFQDHEADGRRLAVRLKVERPELAVYILQPEAGVVEILDTENALSEQ